MSPMTSVEIVLRRVVTNNSAIGVPVMQEVPIFGTLNKIYTEIPCQQFILASTIQKNSLLLLCSMNKTAKVDLEGFMLHLNMVSRMTIMNQQNTNLRILSFRLYMKMLNNRKTIIMLNENGM